MVNQWGRDGNFSSSASRSSGIAGILVAALVALVLGAGGGYTAARLLGGAASGDLTARDTRIAELERQVSDLRFTTQGNESEETALRQRVEELTKANETLKALADDNNGNASAAAQAEIAALKKTIEEAGDNRAELNRARRSLQISELQIIELEGTIRSQAEELASLRKSLTAAADQGDTGRKALSDRIKLLEAALADARKELAVVADLRRQLEASKSDLDRRTAELKTSNDSAATLRAEIDRVKVALAKARKDLAAAQEAITDGSGEAESLQKELAAAEAQLAARDGDVRKVEAQLAAIRTELDAAKAKAGRADAEKTLMGMTLGVVRSEKEKLEAEVAVLTQTVESLQAAQREDTAPQDVTSGGDETPAPLRRDTAAVRTALEDMPGYDRLTPDKQIELARRLENGECVADALKSTLGRVPAISLRNLIRDLGSKC
ncbi:MAG: hypothetical protein KL863_09405 [Rhizobium sp.]|nr:hypothetical protein [Rhizobium sp.]